VGSVDAVWPAVGVVAADLSGGGAVHEVQHGCGPFAQPFTAGFQGCRAVVPVPVSTDTDGMSHFMQGRAYLLITGAGAETHPATVGGFGCRGARAVVDGQRMVFDRRIGVVIFYGRFHGGIDAGVISFREAGYHVVTGCSPGYGNDLDDITVAHGVGTGQGVGPHVIDGGRLKAVDSKQVTGVAKAGTAAVVQERGFGVGAPADTALNDARPSEGTPEKGNRRSSGVLFGGGHGGYGAGGVGKAVSQHRFIYFGGRSGQAGQISFQVVVHGLGYGNGSLETVGAHA